MNDYGTAYNSICAKVHYLRLTGLRRALFCQSLNSVYVVHFFSGTFIVGAEIFTRYLLTLIVPSANSVSLLEIAVGNRFIHVIHKNCIVYLFM